MAERGNGLLNSGGFKINVPESWSFERLAKQINACVKGVLICMFRQQLPRNSAHRLYYTFKISTHIDEQGFCLRWIVDGALKSIYVKSENREFLNEVIVQFCSHFENDLIADFGGALGNFSIKFFP